MALGARDEAVICACQSPSSDDVQVAGEVLGVPDGIPDDFEKGVSSFSFVRPCMQLGGEGNEGSDDAKRAPLLLKERLVSFPGCRRDGQLRVNELGFEEAPSRLRVFLQKLGN